MNLPNELLLIILADVLATYVHSLVFLPSHSRRWNARGALRSVSKQFKAVADNIWISTVGSEDVWHEFGKLRLALSTGTYDGPEESTTSPLIRAYGAYVAILILLGDPFAQLRKAAIACDPSASSLTRGYYSHEWSRFGLDLISKVRPREFAHIYVNSLHSLLDQGCINALSLLIKRTVRYLRRLPLAPEHPDGTKAVSSVLASSISSLESGARQKGTPLSRLDPATMLVLQVMVRSYHPSGEGEQAQTPAESSLQELMKVLTLLVETWSKEYETAQSRKYALHRTIVYGGRNTDLLF